MCFCLLLLVCLFFFHNSPSTESYTLSLHDALPIFINQSSFAVVNVCNNCNIFYLRHSMVLFFSVQMYVIFFSHRFLQLDRKSTRLNSSHVKISFAVFCLKKKNRQI